MHSPLSSLGRNASHNTWCEFTSAPTTDGPLAPSKEFSDSLETSAFLGKYADAIVTFTLAENFSVTDALSETFFSRTPASSPTPSLTKIDTPPREASSPAPRAGIRLFVARRTPPTPRAPPARDKTKQYLHEASSPGQPASPGRHPQSSTGLRASEDQDCAQRPRWKVAGAAAHLTQHARACWEVFEELHSPQNAGCAAHFLSGSRQPLARRSPVVPGVHCPGRLAASRTECYTLAPRRFIRPHEGAATFA
ncbi:hypothetical protein ERJ75_001110600 [Trypanosoma vivax]|nr:hypothetical protein ERJ75_001110600 [Trypanosoma vivax]